MKAKILSKLDIFRSWVTLFCVVFLFVSCGGSGQQIQPSTPSASVLSASFTHSPAAPLMGQPVQFTNTSTGNPTSWEFAFGDGATSTTRNPSHTYAGIGSHTVTLTIRSGSTSISTDRTISIAPAAIGYYIDRAHPAASDSNPGTESLPWKTITNNKPNISCRGHRVYQGGHLCNGYCSEQFRQCLQSHYVQSLWL